MKRKLFLSLSIILSIATISTLALPFLNIKKYDPISGFDLIFNISKRAELVPSSGSGQFSFLLVNHYRFCLL